MITPSARRISRSIVLATIAVAGFATSAHAAVLTVDDNRAQCPSAGFTGVQAAVDAAAAGDTVAICAGNYVEGSGAPGTNAVTINKPLTIRGDSAGAVTIRPNPAGGGAIADPGSLGPNSGELLRNATGNVISVTAGPTQISGVRVLGNNVLNEAGVAFINASGGVRNAQVSGLYSSSQFGAPTGVGVLGYSNAAGQTNSVVVRRSIIEGYNRVGVMFDAKQPGSDTNSASTVFGSVEECRIQGAGPQEEQAQDGVLVSFGARATVTGTGIHDNFFDPDRDDSAGVRLFDAAVGDSHVNDNNISGNGFGVMNQRQQTAPAPKVNSSRSQNLRRPFVGGSPTVIAGSSALDAELNWWGDPDGPSSAGSPDSKGDPVSPAIDFEPRRTVPAVSPQTWGNDADARPLVDITSPADGATIPVGEPTAVTATAGDDIGVGSVTFRRGDTILGVDTTAPYSATYTPPLGDAGATRSIQAMATDSAGQTTTDQISVQISGGTPTPPNEPETDDAPPTVQLVTPRAGQFISANRAGGFNLTATATDDEGVRTVTFLDDDRTLCVDTAAPFTCSYTPRSGDVGRNTVIAVARDAVMQTATDNRQVRVGRFRARGLSAKTVPKTDRTKPFRFVTTGKLALPTGVDAAAGCRTGWIALSFQVGGSNVNVQRARLGRDCKFSKTVSFSIARRFLGRGKVRLVTEFLGNEIVTRARAKSQTLTVR